MVARRWKLLASAVAVCLCGIWLLVSAFPASSLSSGGNAHLDYVSGVVVSVEPESHALSIHATAMDEDTTFAEDPIRFVFSDNSEFYDFDVGKEITIGYIHGEAGSPGARNGYCAEFKGQDSPSEREPLLAASHDLTPSPVYSCEGKIASIDSDNALVTLSVESSSPNAKDLGIRAGGTCSFDLSAWTMRENLATYNVGDAIGIWFSEFTTDDGAYKAWCAQPV